MHRASDWLVTEHYQIHESGTLQVKQNWNRNSQILIPKNDAREIRCPLTSVHSLSLSGENNVRASRYRWLGSATGSPLGLSIT